MHALIVRTTLPRFPSLLPLRLLLAIDAPFLPCANMQSMQRRIQGRFVPKTADESQVSVLLKDFEDADKMLNRVRHFPMIVFKSTLTTQLQIVEGSKAWRDASSESQRKKLFQAHGVRWSELWRLPYWDPPRQLVVDSMHCIFEGLVPYHFREILGLTTANAKTKFEDPPAFRYSFETVDAEVNQTLADDQKLNEREIMQVEKIHRDRVVSRLVVVAVDVSEVYDGLRVMHSVII